ncbi:hypothetical protein BDK51DRAFT_37532 [Blyttiomyces helicus]|uniref:Uncharacterized protein n=1 Tax=Blyttiomyces helicus TaxID=388810 RepID=A0A4P9WEQ6_9FUNG|nr:hypothetical protein BDK51DRAFT_37532 [Blyttiomyces helicus]|eukprot:RKO91211.1 hypothetical protein BDK51DRAFT_37532 [Blyttiomyces helicus]
MALLDDLARLDVWHPHGCQPRCCPLAREDGRLCFPNDQRMREMDGPFRAPVMSLQLPPPPSGRVARPTGGDSRGANGGPTRAAPTVMGPPARATENRPPPLLPSSRIFPPALDSPPSLLPPPTAVVGHDSDPDDGVVEAG